MADYPFLPLYTDAYMADTKHLTTEENGAYLMLLMCAWRTRECRLPDDDTRLSRMAGLGIKKWRKMRPVIAEFFSIDDGWWTQKRLLKERARNDITRSQKSQAGKASALKRKETAPTAVGQPYQQSINHIPESKGTPNGVLPRTRTFEDSEPIAFGGLPPLNIPESFDRRKRITQGYTPAAAIHEFAITELRMTDEAYRRSLACFTDWATGTGQRLADPDARFRAWLREDAAKRRGGPRQRSDDIADATARFVARGGLG